jgi:hypothetical protein
MKMGLDIAQHEPVTKAGDESAINQEIPFVLFAQIRG